MDIGRYLSKVKEKYDSGQATELSYRGALEDLFQSIDPTITVINEPKKSEGGMPDFLFQRDGIPLGWAEAKDIDKDVIKLKGYSKPQRERYENAYPNLIYTNGVDFEFIRNKESVHFVSIADFLMGLQPNPENFAQLERQLQSFVEEKPISIRSAQKLAEHMAGKAAIIKDEIGIALADDPEFRQGLGRQFTTFKENLLPNLTPGEFADIYAETITYGMFAARLHDDTLDTFSRQEALEKLPKSNPFLRGLFQYIAGFDIPDRLRYVVDDLAEVLRASDPHALFEDFGKFTARNDPFIHFYETFLAAYNPKKRKARGVWYTPEPVVDFIVRAVDDVLRSEFGIADGLADTGKVTVDWDTGETKNGKPVTIRKDVHRVQILDPATGTGTFLAKTVQTIADRVKGRAPGMWSSYVENDLLPRLHGFELLMASYAMCHMKLDMQLTESGYVPSKNPPRLSVWLTNALEPAEREVKDLFFQQLADEARGASEVKRQTPIMCVIGNPPYSGVSQNNGDWITNLIEDYKYVDGKHFGERKHWLQDDYVKFIRMSEETIAKNPSGGVLGFITNHGYLDNPTFRGMRWHLLRTFDKIWVMDLHGNSKKKEVSPDGSTDVNVFDIQQGVAIIVAAKFGEKNDALAEVLHSELWGKRSCKYEALREMQPQSGELVQPEKPFLMFNGLDPKVQRSFVEGFSLSEIFDLQSSAFVTGRDAVNISFDKSEAQSKLVALRGESDAQIRNRFGPNFNDSRDWTVATARADAKSVVNLENLDRCLYRAFDKRYTYYTGVSRGLYSSPQPAIFRGHKKSYLALAHARINAGGRGGRVFVSESLFDFHLCTESTYSFPLYCYPDETADQADALAPTERTLNLDPKLYAKICKAAGIDPADMAGPEDDFRAPTGDARPSEVKVFDYIYGVLHSPDYRATFAEFLKIDFPRIPYPANAKVFQHVSEKGEALRRLHLMEPAAIGDAAYPFLTEEGADPEEANNEVAPAHPKFRDGRVYINKHQYFDSVPQVAWNFYIGGYQPAQKWLKDRKGRTLDYDDVGHYQKIVKILLETDRIMKEIALPLDLEE